MKSFLKRTWRWLLAGLIALFLLFRYGGATVVVLNRAYRPICEVYVSADAAERGPNRIWVQINSPQSRDIHLPLLLNLFTPRNEREWHLWAVDCDGQDLDEQTFDGQAGSTLIFEVKR